MSQLKILHNPRCSKSRKTLEIIQHKGTDVEVIKYLETPPDSIQLARIVDLLGVNVDDVMRKGEEDFKKHIKDKKLSDAEKIEILSNHPKIIERPIVFNEKKAIIGRPPENVLELL